jgi:hypothetical protein
MLFSDLALSRRLERAEGHACAQFAKARRQLFPDSGAGWIECAGAYAVFDGVDSPVTQSFAAGIFEDFTASSLDVIERFFFERRAHADLEVSPLAGFAFLNQLCARNYKPIEVSSVLYRIVGDVAGEERQEVSVRVAAEEENQLWGEISARGWHTSTRNSANFFARQQRSVQPVNTLFVS